MVQATKAYLLAGHVRSLVLLCAATSTCVGVYALDEDDTVMRDWYYLSKPLTDLAEHGDKRLSGPNHYFALRAELVRHLPSEFAERLDTLDRQGRP